MYKCDTDEMLLLERKKKTGIGINSFRVILFPFDTIEKAFSFLIFILLCNVRDDLFHINA